MIRSLSKQCWCQGKSQTKYRSQQSAGWHSSGSTEMDLDGKRSRLVNTAGQQPETKNFFLLVQLSSTLRS